MELFNVTKNRYFIAVQMMINRIKSGEKITVRDFPEQLSRLSGDVDKASLDFLSRIQNNDIEIFDFSDKDQVKLRLDAAIRLAPCYAEKVWLDMALSDPHSGLFFDKECREELRRSLGIESMTDVPFYTKREYTDSDELSDELGEKLRIILKAIHGKNKIVYSNHSAKGDYTNKTAIPYKVQYAVAEDRLRVSMWSVDEQRPIMANLSKMYDISLSEVSDDSRSIKEIVESRLLPEPLVFIVTDERDALEKALHTFSKHSRNVTAIKDENRYKFEIFYYTFEESSLISDIMAFGPVIEVIKPQSIREEVIARVTNYSALSASEKK